MRLPTRGGYVEDPARGVVYWVPAIPQFENLTLLKSKGYELLEDDEALVFALLTTFAEVVQIIQPGQAPQYCARPEDIVFARRRVALAFRMVPGEHWEPSAGGLTLLPAADRWRRFGECGVDLLAGGSSSHRDPYLLSPQDAASHLFSRIHSLLPALAALQPVHENWRPLRQELHQVCQALVDLCWQSAGRDAGSSSQEPTLGPIFRNGIARGPTPMPLYSVIHALENGCSDAPRWVTQADGLAFTHQFSKGEVIVMLHPPGAVGADAPPAPPWQSPLRVAHLRGSVQELMADVVPLIMLLYHLLPKGPDGTVKLTPELLLGARGRKQMTRQVGHERRNRGWRSEDIPIIVEVVERSTWLHLSGDVQIRLQQVSFVDAPFIQVERRTFEPEPGSEPRLKAWWIRPGPWFEAFHGKMLGLYLQAPFHESPVQGYWRKRLARYLFFQLRIAAGQGDASLQYSVGQLEQSCSLPFKGGQRQEATRKRFQRELEWLEQIGMIGRCDYVRPLQDCAQVLKRYRETHQLTQEQLAEMLLMEPRTLRAYESGKPQPNQLTELRRIARVLQVAPEELGMADRWANPTQLDTYRWLDQWRHFKVEIPIGPALLAAGYQQLLERAQAQRKRASGKETSDAHSS